MSQFSPVNVDGVPKEAFIAPAALIAISIDGTRIPVYPCTLWPEVVRNWPMLLGVALSAYLGTYASGWSAGCRKRPSNGW